MEKTQNTATQNNFITIKQQFMKGYDADFNSPVSPYSVRRGVYFSNMFYSNFSSSVDMHLMSSIGTIHNLSLSQTSATMLKLFFI